MTCIRQRFSERFQGHAALHDCSGVRFRGRAETIFVKFESYDQEGIIKMILEFCPIQAFACV
jgi:hypothetical protein